MFVWCKPNESTRMTHAELMMRPIQMFVDLLHPKAQTMCYAATFVQYVVDPEQVFVALSRFASKVRLTAGNIDHEIRLR